MHIKLVEKFTGGSGKKPRSSSKAPSKHWQAVRRDVFSGKYAKPDKRFLIELQTACMTIGRHQNRRTHRPEASFDNVVKKELQQINDSTLKRPAAGQSHKLDAVESAKKQEAYRMALKCVLFPMIDHTEIRKSQESVDAETSAKQQQQQVTVQVLKELSKSISKQLKADKLSDQIKQRECDPLFVKALVAFQREVFTSKQIETLCSNGATFDDLMAIMQRNIEHELENGESNEVLVTERLERFGEMLKKAADFVCTAEMMRDRKRQERAAKREKKKANNSSMPDASEICKSNAVGVESAKNHYRSRTTPDNGNSKDSLTAIPEGTTSDIGSGVLEITEFVRHALAVDRRLHLKTMAELQTSHVAKGIAHQIRLRLNILEQQLTEEQLTAENDYSGINPNAFYYARKLEKMALDSYLLRFQALYLADYEKLFVDQQLSNSQRYLITICVVEARGLALKRGRAWNNSFAVVEHGSKQRFETDVASETCAPFWDQRSQLTVRGASKKPIKITIWDKIEESVLKQPSIFSRKFWSEEQDDFLGVVSFQASSLINEALKSTGQQLDRWFKLQKRSKRSTVAGEVRLQFRIEEFSQTDSSVPFIGSMDHLDEGEGRGSVDLDKPLYFLSTNETYEYLLRHLMANSTESLAATQAILDEFGEHYRLGQIWRQLARVKILLEKYQQGSVADVFRLDSAMSQLTTAVTDALQCTQSVRLISPARIEMTNDGQFRVHTPQVTAVGQITITKRELDEYLVITQALADFQMNQILRYKDCFPLDTPAGALITTLNMLNTFWFGNQLLSLSPEKVSSTEEIRTLIVRGTMERYLRLNEISAPMMATWPRKLADLATLIELELEQDLKYFCRPFAADADLLDLTAGVYVKNLILVMSQLAEELKATGRSDNHFQDFMEVFDLFFTCRSIQDRFFSLLQSKENGCLIQEFAIYDWIMPFIERWIQESERKLIEWIESAVNVDNFQPISNGDAPFSTSVVDMLTCLNQICDCLIRFEWLRNVDSLSAEHQRRRKRQWLNLITLFSRTITRGLSKYCTLLLRQVSQDQLMATAEDEKLKNEAKYEEFSMKKACVKLNNLEKARDELNQLFETLQVDQWASYAESTAERLPFNEIDDAVSGYLSITVVLAENLKACDANGLSDPYCLICVKEQSSPDNKGIVKQIARTRIIPKSLNPRWNETFSWYLRCATDLQITIMDWDRLNQNEFCASGKLSLVEISKKLSDSQTHEIWVELEPQGRFLVRMQLEPVVKDTKTDLASIDYYFRKGFRTLKTFSQDLMSVCASVFGSFIHHDLARIIIDAEKTGRQGRGSKKSWLNRLSHRNGGADADKNDNDEPETFVAHFEAETAASVIMSQVDQQLELINRVLYAKVCKEFLRFAWKEILSIAESLMIPQLYGDGVLLPSLNRSKPLTERQVQLLWRTVELLKMFFHADGSEQGLPLKQLETNTYVALYMAADLYWTNIDSLSSHYGNIVSAEKLLPTVGGGVQSDFLLRLARIRAQGDKHFAEFFRAKLKSRACIRK